VPYTDGTRIYISGADNWVNTYRLSDGALLWTGPIGNTVQGGPQEFDGFAVSNGVVYSTGEQGLVAWNAATGRRLWSSASVVWGKPVVAGSHVYGITDTRTGHTAVSAFPSAGCGSPTCAPLWQADVGGYVQYPQIGGADPNTLFLTYQKAGVAAVSRLSAVTGQVQWTTPTGYYMGDLVRGGNVIWIFEEYFDASGRDGYRILGFSAGATSHTPLVVIPMTNDTYWGFPQHLAIVNGSLLQKLNGRILAAYRVPGT
jgi:outer membrane protein assembly factor BamB